jgi:signal transduction histidine kinase
MHDGLAQVLGYVNTKAQAVRRFLAIQKIDEAQTHLYQLEEAARAVYADVREAILGLRSTISQEKDLAVTLSDYIRNFEEQSGIHTVLVIADQTDLSRLTPTVEVQTIRIIQEALTNIRRHAEANAAHIDVARRNEHILITIEDDGCGFDLTQPQPNGRPHFGLQTMRERAEGVGGALTVHSTPGSGARICVTLPLSQELR